MNRPEHADVILASPALPTTPNSVRGTERHLQRIDTNNWSAEYEQTPLFSVSSDPGDYLRRPTHFQTIM